MAITSAIVINRAPVLTLWASIVAERRLGDFKELRPEIPAGPFGLEPGGSWTSS